MIREPMSRDTGVRSIHAARPAVVGRRATAVVALLMTGAVAGCHFDVTNPGPVQDEFLNDPAAITAEVNGMGQSLANATNYIVLQGAVAARELFPTGMTGQFGIEPQNMSGYLTAEEQGAPWSDGQQARWLAEHGLERIHEVLGDSAFASSADVAQAQIWAGYSNRTLGENMCEAVIDGGAPMPSVTYLERANASFTSAIATATAAGKADLALVATAGRAAVRAQLGDWAGAVADAALVPTTFVYELPYYDIGDEYQYNRTFWSSTSESFYKAHSVWNTVNQQYYLDSHDPRVKWEATDKTGTGAVEGVGPVPWYPQMKYDTKTSAVRLSSGREMRLIEAEAALVEGRWADAMTVINGLRAAIGVAPWPEVSGATAAWSFLKRERGIELWLEGRRLGDLRRWHDASTPGELSPLEVPSAQSHLKGQDLCFPIPRGEIDTNPNIPKS